MSVVLPDMQSHPSLTVAEQCHPALGAATSAGLVGSLLLRFLCACCLPRTAPVCAPSILQLCSGAALWHAGEAAPVPKGPGDEVLGGTINAGDETLEVLCHATLQCDTLCLCVPAHAIV